MLDHHIFFQFAAWEEPENTNRFRDSGLTSSLISKMNRITMLSTKQRVIQDIEEYRKEIALKKSKYQEKSKELIAVNTQFNLKHSLKLIESEAAYLVTLEIGIPIDFVAVQSSVDTVSLDVDKYFGLQTQHKNMEQNVCRCDLYVVSNLVDFTSRNMFISTDRMISLRIRLTIWRVTIVSYSTLPTIT